MRLNNLACSSNCKGSSDFFEETLTDRSDLLSKSDNSRKNTPFSAESCPAMAGMGRFCSYFFQRAISLSPASLTSSFIEGSPFTSFLSEEAKPSKSFNWFSTILVVIDKSSCLFVSNFTGC